MIDKQVLCEDLQMVTQKELIKIQHEAELMRSHRRSTAPKRLTLARAQAFVAMDEEAQFEFIAERFREVDGVELAGVFRAIFGHPHDKGRRPR